MAFVTVLTVGSEMSTLLLFEKKNQCIIELVFPLGLFIVFN